MKVKRFVASIGASFDQFISKMENHEAVANCVIEDVQLSAANVRAETKRVEHRLNKYTEEQNKLEQEKTRWLARAKECLSSDEKKALECVRQSKIVEKRLERAISQTAQSQELYDKLKTNLSDIENKLSDLESRRAMLSSREVRANVVNKVHNEISSASNEAIFDRWEREVMCSEYKDSAEFFQASDYGTDSKLSQEFEEKEEHEALLKTLEELKSGDRNHGESNEQ